MEEDDDVVMSNEFGSPLTRTRGSVLSPEDGDQDPSRALASLSAAADGLTGGGSVEAARTRIRGRELYGGEQHCHEVMSGTHDFSHSV